MRPILLEEAGYVHKNVRKLFGKKLRTLRLAKGWSQEDLGHRAGIGQQHISDLETGKKEACLDLIVALADSLDVTLAELMKDI